MRGLPSGGITMEDKKTLLQVSAYLLKYPDEELRSSLEALLEVVTDINDEMANNLLLPVIDHLQDSAPDELMKSYVLAFDFGKKTNMYVTFAKHGEQRERGPALLDIKQSYQKAGWDMHEEELPDYLPLMLEFAAQAPAHDGLGLLKAHLPSIEAIGEELTKIDSMYKNVLRFVVQTIKDANLPDASEEAKANV